MATTDYPAFSRTRDRHVYLGYLGEYARAHSCDIHAYVLMTNHVHLLATAREPGAISGFMQVLNRRYSRYANKAHERTGTLYEGRFRSSITGDCTANDEADRRVYVWTKEMAGDAYVKADADMQQILGIGITSKRDKMIFSFALHMGINYGIVYSHALRKAQKPWNIVKSFFTRRVKK